MPAGMLFASSERETGKIQNSRAESSALYHHQPASGVNRSTRQTILRTVTPSQNLRAKPKNLVTTHLWQSARTRTGSVDRSLNEADDNDFSKQPQTRTQALAHLLPRSI